MQRILKIEGSLRDVREVIDVQVALRRAAEDLGGHLNFHATDKLGAREATVDFADESAGRQFESMVPRLVRSNGFGLVTAELS